MATTRKPTVHGDGFAHQPRPQVRRLSRAWLRATAWVVGGIAFFGPWAALGLSPKPATEAAAAAASPTAKDKPRRVIHRVVRRVIITRAPAAPSGVNVVYSGGGSSGGSSSGGGGGAPVATTGGS